MSVTVVSARVKYGKDAGGSEVHAVPRGLCVFSPPYNANRHTAHATNSSDTDKNKFLGISMAPTLSKQSATHIGVAVAGVCTALVKYEAGKTRYHMGTLLKVDGADESYLKKADAANPSGVVAIYLQSNGPTTALVWVTRVRSLAAANLPTLGLMGDDGDAPPTTSLAPEPKRQRTSRSGVRDHSSRLRAAAIAAVINGQN